MNKKSTPSLNASDQQLVTINQMLTQQLIDKKTEVNRLSKALKQAEKTKTEVQGHYLRAKTLLDTAPDPFTAIGLDGIIIDVNQAMLKAVGVKRKNLIGQPFCDCFTQPEKANNLIFLVQRDKKILNYELHLKPLKGITHPYLISAVLTNDDTGKAISVFAAARDITDHLQDQQDLKISEEKFRLLYSTMDQGMALSQIIIDESGKPVDYVFLDMNPSFMDKLGMKANQVIGKSLCTVFPQIEQYWLDEFQQVALSGNPSHYENYLSVNQHHYAVHSYCPLPSQLAIIVTDITDRKQAEAHILYLSYHDQLTGLYNRRFYEEELIRLDTQQNLPLSLIMGDVNGLKLINDTFGHVIGDTFLVKIAEVLKRECRRDDIIARLGGDEFMILLPKTDAQKAKAIIARIQQCLLEMKEDQISASVSFGYETKVTMDEDTVILMKKTEDHMYQHKLTESTSLRSASVELIMKTFLEKNQREMLHSMRVSQLSEALALELGMSQDDVNQTRITGLMHDIGKIGISESILNLPRALTDDEWIEIKKHTEIGFRILSASTQFYEIAGDVLQHHERYDGKGYPSGLQGEAISLIARIVSIADAYDAMSSDRPYRKAFGHDDIVEMLSANAGTQFDPDLIPLFIAMITNHHKKNLA